MYGLCVHLCLFYVLSAVHAIEVTVIDVRSIPPGPTIVAIQSSVGLMNKNEPSVYSIRSDDDLFWLAEILSSEITRKVDPMDFLAASLSKFGGILYDSSQENLLPSVVTVAGVFLGVPIDGNLFAKFPATKIIFNSTYWNSPEQAVEESARLSLDKTTSLAIQDQNYIYGGFLVDFLVKESLFITYLDNLCIPFTTHNDILKKIIGDAPWKKPIRVYGYNGQDVVFGGDLFEAETNCVNTMGQVATAHSDNLSFWSLYKPFKQTQQNGEFISAEKLVQPESPKIEYDPTKTYVALVYGDMDNIDFVQDFGYQHMKYRSDRCSNENYQKCFPLSWTLSPNLIKIAPSILRWYYGEASKTGTDWFIMPPSGTLYSYPGEMPDDVQSLYVQQQNEHALIMNTTGTVHWEWVLTWSWAWDNYFPKYINSSGTISFFLNNVPWPIPILDMWFLGETYAFVGDSSWPNSVVAFKPAFNWQENGPSGGNPGNATEIAKLINNLKIGSIQYVYVIQNTDIASVFNMVDLLEPHVVIVGYKQLVDLAHQAKKL